MPLIITITKFSNLIAYRYPRSSSALIGQCNGKVHVTCNYKDLQIQRYDGNKNVKTTTLNLHHTFCTFLCPISRFMASINKQRRKSNFSSETWICPWICSIGIQLQLGLPTFDKVSVCIGKIAIKTKRAQTHFSSDVLIAITSLDLKTLVIEQRTPPHTHS